MTNRAPRNAATPLCVDEATSQRSVRDGGRQKQPRRPRPQPVAGGQGYELGYFARKHGISREQAKSLIQRIGNDRAKLNAAAELMKGR